MTNEPTTDTQLSDLLTAAKRSNLPAQLFGRINRRNAPSIDLSQGIPAPTGKAALQLETSLEASSNRTLHSLEIQMMGRVDRRGNVAVLGLEAANEEEHLSSSKL